MGVWDSGPPFQNCCRQVLHSPFQNCLAWGKDYLVEDTENNELRHGETLSHTHI